MGMYDYVKASLACPKCKTEIVDWQSKDGECIMDTLQPQDVRRFYSSCPKCGVWIDCEVKCITYQIKMKVKE